MKNRSRSGTILVANKEAACLIVRQALERVGYRVLEVRDAAEGLEMCLQPIERIDLLLANVPNLRVQGFVERPARLLRRTKVIYTSPDADLLFSQGVLAPGTAHLREPFTGAEVLERVREVLNPSQGFVAQLECPRCASINVWCSRRRWLNWLPPVISATPYRCGDCRTRFLRFGYLSRGDNATQVH